MKLKIFLVLIFISSCVLAETKLLMVGGGVRPPEAMKEFVTLAGSEKADVLIIPWASETTEGAESVKTELAAFTKGNLEVLPHRLTAKDLEGILNKIEKSTGIFFSGGNQNLLMSLMREYKLVEVFRKKFRDGFIFGGTSAGTAIMSNPMLTGKGELSVLDGSQIELAEGLGLLPSHIIVDQHFIMRSRFNRLAGVILTQKKSIGVAVDQGTSLLVKGKNAQVIGPSQVLIFKKTARNKLEVTVVSPNEIFHF